MNLLDLAEQYYLITFGVVIGIGLLHGAILGRGVRSRFPSFKKHARIVSSILLVLFLVNAISSLVIVDAKATFSFSKNTDYLKLSKNGKTLEAKKEKLKISRLHSEMSENHNHLMKYHAEMMEIVEKLSKFKKEMESHEGHNH